MKWKPFNPLVVFFLISALMFFGTAVWMIVQNVTSEKIRWLFDAFSLLLFISLFFWLMVLGDSFQSGDG